MDWTNAGWKSKARDLDWTWARRSLTTARFRPLYDRAFGQLHRQLAAGQYVHDANLKGRFLTAFDLWLRGSQLNRLSGLENFEHRDFIIGVTHGLDDLHIRYGQRLVVLEKEYLYHQRIRPEIPRRTLTSLQAGDVLVFAAPFAFYGDLHPQTHDVLARCHSLGIPIHIDGAWNGCLRGFEFNFDHPAIHSVAFSLSKGLGLGSHRVGVRYSRTRELGPVSTINDFNMELVPVMWTGLRFIEEFGSDYIQNRYGAAYEYVCQQMHLRPSKAIHIAHTEEGNEWLPVGVRAVLRYLVDDVDEMSKL